MNLSFATIKKFSTAYEYAWKRFPVSLVLSWTIAIYWVVLNHVQDASFLQEMILMVGVLAFLGATCIHLFSEITKRKPMSGIAWGILAFGLIAFYFFDGGLQKVDFRLGYRFAVWILVFHLVVTIIPFLKRYTFEAFTHWNIGLFVRFLEATLFGLILWGGLSLAELALDKLFGLDLLDGKGIFDLFLLICGFFHVPYVLSGVPDMNSIWEVDQKNKRMWKVLSHYILTPIVVIFGVILIAYLIKILGSSSDTLSWVTYMQFWYFVFGIFTYLIHRYYLATDESSLSKTYVKWFFIASFPILLLMAKSIWDSIQSEGVKMDNYLFALVAIWLLIVSAYIFISRKDDLRIMSVGMMVLAVVSILGPLSLRYNVTQSQSQRLLRALEKEGLVKDGKLIRPLEKYYAHAGDLSNSYQALNAVHGLDFLNDIDKDNILEGKANELFRDIYIWRRSVVEENRKTLNITNQKPISTEQYARIFPLYVYQDNQACTECLYFDENDGFVYVKKGQDPQNLGPNAVLTRDSILLLANQKDTLTLLYSFVSYKPITSDTIEVKGLNSGYVLLKTDNH